MRLHHVFLFGLLSASAVLAGRLQYAEPNRTTLWSSAPAATQGMLSNNWAGGVLMPGSGSINYVQGKFTVPHVWGEAGSGLGIWVGIDGVSCAPVLQAGIFCIVNDIVSCLAWYEWYPEPAKVLDMNISEGDIIEVSVSAESPTSGFITINNHRTKQIEVKEITSVHELCMNDAEWIVEGPVGDGKLMPFADFVSVEFSDALAIDNERSYGAGSGTFMELYQNDQYLAYASVWDSAVMVIHAP